MSEKKVDDWGPLKENIRPIQQVRKTKCLKVALTPTEDVKGLQEYEIELLTYSGDDPLSVWCNYIRFIEHNFPKGKREEHVKHLIERSLKALKNEKRYFNDDRFVDMVLKYAILVDKPINVYNYMFSHNIGCKSAIFYISWSHELEQLGNLKKACDVLIEGIQCRAEPVQKLQSYYKSFEIRLEEDKLKSNSRENIFSSENNRSAFAVVKPQKKNVASTSHEAVVENRKVLLGRQQPQPESFSASSKVPFKMNDSENIPPQFPIICNQNFEIYEESEQKTSKENSVKVKTLDHSLQTPNKAKQTFKLYCDENEQSIQRSVPKTPKVLCKDSENFNPAVALFEPEDPSKKPMYPKSKVYRGGTEEFSLEEIRAAEWLAEKKKAETDYLLMEQQKKIEEHRKTEVELNKKIQYLTKQVELFQNHFQNSSQKLSKFPETDDVNTANTKTKKLKTENVKIIEDYENPTLHACNDLQNSLKSGPTRDSSLIFKSSTDCFENRDTEKTGYSDAVKMFQELYNNSLSHPVVENERKQTLTDEFSEKCSLTSSTNFPEINEVSQQKDIQGYTLREYNCDLPFTFYRDPTGVIDSNEMAPLKTSQDKMEEGDTENIPPDGYIQESSKRRELAGILQPSKDILFIPLEEQEEMYDDDDNSDSEENYLYYNERQYTDDTLIPPSNTEQFKAAQFLSSTPYVPRNKSPTLEKSGRQIISPKSNDGPAQHLPTENPSATVEECDQENKIQTEFKVAKERSSLPRVSKMLSVIMETSTEAYSKSSNSSASLTRSSNIDQVLSNRISMPKQYSKSETCEPSTLNSISEVHGISNTNCPNSSEIPNNDVNLKIPLQIVDCDPFDQEINCNFLQSVNLNGYKNLYYINKSMRSFKEGENIHIGNESYRIISLAAEGAYAKVYEACMFDMGIDTKKFALKVCKNSDEWEFYICNELRKRLLNNKIMSENKNVFMDVISAEKFLNGIIIVSNFGNLGTLLDIVNFSKKQQSSIMPELLMMYFSLEILHIVSKLHNCNIIHGDIKPDNFLIINDAFDNNPLEKLSEVSCLQLIDFGRAVDLNFYDKGTCFTSAFKTDYFKCNEMKDKKPWVYQLDWYGVASCIHALLFSEYMAVTKTNDVWGIQKKLKRYWCVSLWDSLFKKLLNIPECYQEPDLQPEINIIQSELRQNSGKFKYHFDRLGKLYKTGK